MKTASLNAAEYLHLAYDALSRNEHHPALIYLKEASAIEPQNAPVRHALSSLYLKLGMIERGTEELEYCAKIEPRQDVLQVRLAGLYWRIGRQADAVRCYGELTASQDVGIAAYSGAMLSINEGVLGAAADRLRQGLSEVPESHPMRADLANLLYALFTSAPLGDVEGPESKKAGETYLGAYAKLGSSTA